MRTVAAAIACLAASCAVVAAQTNALSPLSGSWVFNPTNATQLALFEQVTLNVSVTSASEFVASFTWNGGDGILVRVPRAACVSLLLTLYIRAAVMGRDQLPQPPTVVPEGLPAARGVGASTCGVAGPCPPARSRWAGWFRAPVACVCCLLIVVRGLLNGIVSAASSTKRGGSTPSCPRTLWPLWTGCTFRAGGPRRWGWSHCGEAVAWRSACLRVHDGVGSAVC
jgi:hypothetical protein